MNMEVALKVYVKQQPLGFTDLFNNYKKTVSTKKIMLGITLFSIIVKVVFGFQEKYVIIDIYINILKLFTVLGPGAWLYACVYFVKIHMVYTWDLPTIVCTLYLNKKSILKQLSPYILAGL